MSACAVGEPLLEGASLAGLRQLGVNGANVYTESGIGDVRVALYTSMVRDLSITDIYKFVDAAKEEGAARGMSAEYMRDLFLIAFQGRDVRGGKGERSAAISLFEALLDNFPERRAALLAIWAEYGCWRDLFVMAHGINRKIIIELALAQLRSDEAAPAPSLLAKWMPREGSALDRRNLVAEIATTLFPEIQNHRARMAAYRRHITAATARLKVTETNMCGGTWASIKPSAVPGRCLNLNRKAFFNQKLKGVGLRSSAEDRLVCAANFKAHLDAILAGKATVNGGNTVFPHTVCQQVRKTDDAEEVGLLEAQWSAIKEKVVAAGAMGRVLPMCDFSGSMSGTPMDVSLALGLLLSEINHKAFRDCILSFDSKPHWITFTEGMKLRAKCEEAVRHGQGTSTNFEAAMELVLGRLVKFGVPADEAPEDIVVFTDMGFDAAARSSSSGWSTIVEDMKRRYAAAGYTMPRLVIWNLRAAYKEYHATVDEKGVLMLSGWSPSAMKVIMNGIAIQTPYEGMRAVLDDERYDRVRKALA